MEIPPKVDGVIELLADESASTPLSETQRLLLDLRLRQHEENPEDVEPWDKVRNDILSEL